MSSDLKFIEGAELAELLTEKSVEARKASEDSERLVIVDVRDKDEFEEGHVRGATHIPSNKWQDPEILETIMQQFQQADSKTTFVFHCAKSQVRGPTCARIFQERLQQQQSDAVEGVEGSSALPKV